MPSRQPPVGPVPPEGGTFPFGQQWVRMLLAVPGKRSARTSSSFGIDAQVGLTSHASVQPTGHGRTTTTLGLGRSPRSTGLASGRSQPAFGAIQQILTRAQRMIHSPTWVSCSGRSRAQEWSQGGDRFRTKAQLSLPKESRTLVSGVLRHASARPSASANLRHATPVSIVLPVGPAWCIYLFSSISGSRGCRCGWRGSPVESRR